MYKIKKVKDNYEIKDVIEDGVIDVHLSESSELGLKCKIRAIAEDIGIYKDVYNQAIQDVINKMNEIYE